MPPAPAALGFRARTGRATAVLLARDETGAPHGILRKDLTLFSTSIPETLQPYHRIMELPLPEWPAAIAPAVTAITALAAHELEALRAAARAHGLRLGDVAVVGSPDRDLARIGNPHVRAHAGEGILFRRALEDAAREADLRVLTLSDRTLPAEAARTLAFEAARIDAGLAGIGRALGRPWRAVEKAAALAAWMALAATGPR